MSNEVECPNLLKKRAGDEVYYWCSEADKYCLKEHGYDCETYDRFIDELEAEEKAEQDSIMSQARAIQEQEASDRYWEERQEALIDEARYEQGGEQ